jgi:hypothetical protein
MQIERLASIGERASERIAAGNDVWDIREINDVGWIFRLVRNRENVPAVIMRRFHALMPSKGGERLTDDRSFGRHAALQWSKSVRRFDGKCNGFLAG